MDRSRLVLGTVQLGMKYGLNNTTGQPTKDESFAILDAALEAGINTFDTAWAYGSAEDVLGEWIKKRSLADNIFIVSKIKPHVLNDYPEENDPSNIVRSEIGKSLKRLNLRSLDGYLLHSPQYLNNKGVLEGLMKVREAGLANHIGVSIYDVADALAALEHGLDFVQVPYNVLDRRLEKTDFFAKTKERGVRVFARSPFLQGLLLMEMGDIPARLAHARPLVLKFGEIARRHELTRVEAALLFAYRCPADHIVFGVETLAQLKDIISIEERSESFGEKCVAELRDAFTDVDRAIVNPSLWSTIQK